MTTTKLGRSIRKGDLSEALIEANYPNLDAYSRVHLKRFRLTLGAIWANWPFKEDEEPLVLNLGGSHLIDQILSEHLGARVISTDFDLRYPWPFQSKFKLILATEVLEHISDQDGLGDLETIAAWRNSGRNCFLKEIRDHLEPEVGRVVLTTPNCASWEALRRWLGRENPHQYDGHVRELALMETLRLVRNAGLEIVDHDTWDCYYKIAPQIAEWAAHLASVWHTHRGDTTYLVAKAPGNAAA